MAIIAGHNALRYAQIIQGVLDDTSFEVGSTAPALLMVPPGKLPFTDLSNADVIMYRATSLEDHTIWEVGAVPYDDTNEQLDRTDALVVASSNSDNTVDFKRADGSGMNVLVEGISGVEFTRTYAITNLTADVIMDCNSAADAELADVLGTLISDLLDAGVIRGTAAA